MSESRTEFVQENLAAAVAEMGQWEDVSVELYTRGVTGHMADACHCPVAVYLAAQVDEEVFISNELAQAFPVTGQTDDIHLPPNVVAFVHAFDAEKHPELIGTDSPHWD